MTLEGASRRCAERWEDRCRGVERDESGRWASFRNEDGRSSANRRSDQGRADSNRHGLGPVGVADYWLTRETARIRRWLTREPPVTIVQPDQHVARRRGRDDIEIAVVIDVAFDDARDGSLEMDCGRRSRQLNRKTMIAGTVLNECRVGATVPIEIAHCALGKRLGCKRSKRLAVQPLDNQRGLRADQQRETKDERWKSLMRRHRPRDAQRSKRQQVWQRPQPPIQLSFGRTRHRYRSDVWTIFRSKTGAAVDHGNENALKTYVNPAVRPFEGSIDVTPSNTAVSKRTADTT